MIIFQHEFRRGFKTMLIWSVCISVFVTISLFLYPTVERNMELFTWLLSRFELLTSAFGLIGTKYISMISYYGIECGAFLGLGGGLYAATMAIQMLTKEEGRKTAEFLFPHPKRRLNILMQKLLAMLVLIILLNLLVSAVSYLAAMILAHPLPLNQFFQFHTAQLFLTAELGLLCFGLSAFMKKDSVVPGIAVTLCFYFLNIFINVNRAALTFRHLTPFYYADGSRVVDGAMPWGMIGISYAAALIILIAGTIKFCKKDISV